MLFQQHHMFPPNPYNPHHHHHLLHQQQFQHQQGDYGGYQNAQQAAMDVAMATAAVNGYPVGDANALMALINQKPSYPLPPPITAAAAAAAGSRDLCKDA